MAPKEASNSTHAAIKSFKSWLNVIRLIIARPMAVSEVELVKKRAKETRATAMKHVDSSKTRVSHRCMQNI